MAAADHRRVVVVHNQASIEVGHMPMVELVAEVDHTVVAAVGMVDVEVEPVPVVVVAADHMRLDHIDHSSEMDLVDCMDSFVVDSIAAVVVALAAVVVRMVLIFVAVASVVGVVDIQVAVVDASRVVHDWRRQQLTVLDAAVAQVDAHVKSPPRLDPDQRAPVGMGRPALDIARERIDLARRERYDRVRPPSSDRREWRHEISN